MRAQLLKLLRSVIRPASALDFSHVICETDGAGMEDRMHGIRMTENRVDIIIQNLSEVSVVSVCPIPIP